MFLHKQLLQIHRITVEYISNHLKKDESEVIVDISISYFCDMDKPYGLFRVVWHMGVAGGTCPPHFLKGREQSIICPPHFLKHFY